MLKKGSKNVADGFLIKLEMVGHFKRYTFIWKQTAADGSEIADLQTKD